MDLRSTATHLPRQFWYFASADRPIGARIHRRGEETPVDGASLIDVTCSHPPTSSFGGLRIVAPTMLRYDEQVRLDLHCGDPTLALQVDATVRTIRPGDAPSTWLVGCVFDAELPEGALDVWVDAGWLTRRSHLRHAVLLSASAVWEGGRRAPDIELCDLGYGGFCVRSTTPAAIGSRLQLDIKERDCRVQLRGEVRWLTRIGESYLVGCMFVGANMNQTVNKIIDFYKSIIADDDDAPADTAQASRPGWLTMSRWWSRDPNPQSSP